MQQIQLNIISFIPVATKGTFSFCGDKQRGFVPIYWGITMETFLEWEMRTNLVLSQFWWKLFDKAILEILFYQKPANLEIKGNYENLCIYNFTVAIIFHQNWRRTKFVCISQLTICWILQIYFSEQKEEEIALFKRNRVTCNESCNESDFLRDIL